MKTVLIVAGEASGDQHAANLIREIKTLDPKIKFFGLGGKNLKKEGVDICFDLVSLAVVGLFEVLRHLAKFKQVFNLLLDKVDQEKPELAILVDYPGFNLRLAEELKKRGIPVIYYISPQVWAWGKERIKTIKRVVDRIIVVFKFEEELYKKYGIPVSFVGHPLLDMVRPVLSKEAIANKFGISNKNKTFALLPGSREKEVKTLLPIMLEAARLINMEFPGSQFLLLRSSAVNKDIFDEILRNYKLSVQMLSDATYEGLSISDFAIVASGTATLETAILGIPMVIVYKVSFLTWAYLKMALKIPYIGLVNVVKGKKVIAEFIQYDAKPKSIADYIVNTMKDKDGLVKIRRELSEVISLLGEKGAAVKAAQVVIAGLQH